MPEMRTVVAGRKYPRIFFARQRLEQVDLHAGGHLMMVSMGSAEWFFDYVQKTLSEFETKSLCRPVILMMKLNMKMMIDLFILVLLLYFLIQY